MKKSVFSVLALVAVMAVSLSFVSCGGSDDKKDGSEGAGVQTPDTSKVDHDSFAATTNIRFVDMDSILRGYDYSRQESEKLDQKSLELQQYQNALASQIQKKANEIQTKYNNNGYMSQQSMDADQKEYNTMLQSADANYGKRAQALNDEMLRTQQTIYKAIENYIIKYNKDKHYDAILFHNAGIYFNPALDITDEIIKGLNSELKAATATEKAEEAK